jgi:hypothetical protein
MKNKITVILCALPLLFMFVVHKVFGDTTTETWKEMFELIKERWND